MAFYHYPITGSFSVDSGSEPIAVSEVPENVVASLQVKSSQESSVSLPPNIQDLDIEIPVLGISGSQELSYGTGIASVKFNQLIFAGGRASSIMEDSLSLIIKGEPKDISTKQIQCLDYSSVTIDSLKLSESLDMGIGSKLSASNYDVNPLSITLHYTVASLFTGSPISIGELQKNPTEVNLVYDYDESTFDMNQYAGQSAPLIQLKDEDTCTSWLPAAKFVSDNPNFQGTSNVMTLTCEKKQLMMSLKSVPEPTPPPEIPTPGEDEDEGEGEGEEVITSPPDDTDTATITTASESPKSNLGPIIGGVVGALAVVTIVSVVILLVIRRRRAMMRFSSSSMSQETMSSTE